MKETYDDERITFEIKIMGIDRIYTIPFDGVYNLEAEDFCEKIAGRAFDDKFILESILSIDLSKDMVKKQVVSFELPAICLPFDVIIKGYITIKKNWESFTSLQKECALCFLERYCMEYEEVKNKMKTLEQKS